MLDLKWPEKTEQSDDGAADVEKERDPPKAAALDARFGEKFGALA